MIRKLLIYILKKLGVKESLVDTPKENEDNEEDEDLKYFFY